jgi:hypothetical protein
MGSPTSSPPPQSQQEAQDTLAGLITRTLAGLPEGTVWDGSRFGGPGYNIHCNDEDTSPAAPKRFQVIGEVEAPAGTTAETVIAAVGDVWHRWGWRVEERDGFRKPNRFGYAPDGYRLQIVAPGRDGYPPVLEGSTPCFPGEIARDGIAFPAQLP